MSEKTVVFEVKDLKKSFPAAGGKEVRAVDGVSFVIHEGETFGLVGESGCGKTTCGRMLLGVYPPTGGEVLYYGQELGTLDRRQRMEFSKNVQMVFQDPYACLDPRMSIGSIISEGLCVHFRLSAEERMRRVNEQLERVGLTSDYASRFPHELSGGQRQRVGIARALAVEPRFIVCDEPIAALDVSIQAQIVNLMIRLQRELSLTYLFISHDLSMVRHISDRIGVMYLGSLVELAGNVQIHEKPLHPYTQALFSAIPVPDPDHSWISNRIRLEGETPSPLSLPPGCKFSSRCRLCTEECRKSPPALREVEPNHFVACHRVAGV